MKLRNYADFFFKTMIFLCLLLFSTGIIAQVEEEDKDEEVEIFSVERDEYDHIYSSNPHQLTSFNKDLFFVAKHRNFFGYELYKLKPGDSIPERINEVANAVKFNTIKHMHFNDQVNFIVARNYRHALELFSWDPISKKVDQLTHLSNRLQSANIITINEINGNLYFKAQDSLHGTELWISDGTVEGTRMVADLNKKGDSYIQNVLPFGNKVIFYTHYNLYIYDPNADELTEIKDAEDNSLLGTITHLTKIGENYYWAAHKNSKYHLYKFNSKLNGATKIKSWDRSDLEYRPNWFTEMNGMLYFTLNDGVHGQQLWRSNGTEKGTVMVKKKVKKFPYSGPMIAVKAIDNVMYFSGKDSLHGMEVWRTDGTAKGTYMIKDLNPGTGNSYPGSFTGVDGKVFFKTGFPSDGQSIWVTDGTEKGTKKLFTTPPSTRGYIIELVFHEGILYFNGNDVQHGTELWISDGTKEGTRILYDFK